MAGINLTDRALAVLQKTLDLRDRNQQVIASNIANANTPGYEARKLSFEKDLRAAISSPQLTGRQSNPKHFPIGRSSISQVQGELEREHARSPLGDGNTVQVEEEMLSLSENQLLYEAATQALKKKLTMLKYAANDGR